MGVDEFPAGLFEVYTPVAGQGEQHLLISPVFAGKRVWKKRHTMLRFYILGRGFVFCWKEEPSKSVLSMKDGLFSLGIGKFVMNSFPKVFKEETDESK